MPHPPFEIWAEKRTLLSLFFCFLVFIILISISKFPAPLPFENPLYAIDCAQYLEYISVLLVGSSLEKYIYPEIFFCSKGQMIAINCKRL